MQWTDFKPANAHSSWLDTYVSLGLPGVALLALVMIWAWLQVVGRLWTGARSLVFAAGAMTAVTFVCFTETVLLNMVDFQWMLVVMIGAKMALDTPDPEDINTRASVFEDPRHHDGEDEDGYWVYRG
jgi:exopolysaccharide production protein ExoQ